MTRIVNTSQVTKAVNKTMLMENLNPVHLNLAQFLHHPVAAPLWTVASVHDSDFDKDNGAWGRWWMAIVQDQNPKQKLRRTLQHLRQFQYLSQSTFTEFGHNPTRFSTEWLVIQLTRLGDHLIAAGLKSEFGFNWPYAYQKVAAYIAKNKLTAVPDIFARLDDLWPASVKMNFHYTQPSFNDCVLDLAEDDTTFGKIPTMKKMRHKHDLIFGGSDVSARQPDTDDDTDATVVARSDSRLRDNSPRVRSVSPPPKKMRKQRLSETAPDSDEDTMNFDEPRQTMAYSDLFR